MQQDITDGIDWVVVTQNSVNITVTVTEKPTEQDRLRYVGTAVTEKPCDIVKRFELAQVKLVEQNLSWKPSVAHLLKKLQHFICLYS